MTTVSSEGWRPVRAALRFLPSIKRAVCVCVTKIPESHRPMQTRHESVTNLAPQTEDTN